MLSVCEIDARGKVLGHRGFRLLVNPHRALLQQQESGGGSHQVTLNFVNNILIVTHILNLIFILLLCVLLFSAFVSV